MNVLFIDQTIREGMQYQGMMFNFDERKKILDYQNKLGVDVTQAGYPPAHPSESEMVARLSKYAQKNDFQLRIAGHCRARLEDAKWVLSTGIKDFHLHSGVNKAMLNKLTLDQVYEDLNKTVRAIRDETNESYIKVSLLDIGRTELDLLKKCATYLAMNLNVDILALPDTSGIMSPNSFAEKIKIIAAIIDETKTRIAVHCHNDLCMSSANTLLGIQAGASVVEATALGIGERNGIADIFIVGKFLKELGYLFNLDVDKVDLFREYYEYVNDLVYKKIGYNLLNRNTPFFGDALEVHVAGTHAIGHYGVANKERFRLNVLCGKNLVRKALKEFGIDFNEGDLQKIVDDVKTKSVKFNRSLDIDEMKEIVENV
jgi:2-isopropylmalate synthase